MEEIWRDIEGYEGLYQVSNMGRVKSLDRVETTNGVVGNRKRNGKIRKLVNNHRGYLLVNLSKNSSTKMLQIHRLVAQAFIPNPKNLPQVNHIDENKTNNRIDNLEWCDEKYNCNYGTRNKNIGNILTNHPTMSKPVIAVKDNRICMFFASTSEAERCGFNHSKISDCCNKKPRYKTHKGFRWMWLEDYLADWWDKEMDKYMEMEKAA